MRIGHIVRSSVSTTARPWPAMGAAIEAPNSSGRLSGGLLSWAEAHGNMNGHVLLVTEPVPVKAQLGARYPAAELTCVGLSDETQPGGFDLEVDICRSESLPRDAFDVAIFQAALEHMIDPVTVIRRIVASLKLGGVLAMHTHTPGFPYHAAPRDYFRFMPDWFEDLPGYLEERMSLLELWCDERHVMVCYKRTH